MAEEISGPKGTMRVFQPIWTSASMQLLGHIGSVVVGRQEYIEAPLLVFLHDHLGDLRIRGGTHNGGKAGGRAVHELHASFSEDGVVGRSQPDLAAFDVRIFRMQIEIGIVQVPKGLLDLIGEQTGHAGIQQRPEIGQMMLAFHMRRQQPPGKIQRLFQVLEGLDLDPSRE